MNYQNLLCRIDLIIKELTKSRDNTSSDNQEICLADSIEDTKNTLLTKKLQTEKVRNKIDFLNQLEQTLSLLSDVLQERKQDLQSIPSLKTFYTEDIIKISNLIIDLKKVSFYFQQDFPVNPIDNRVITLKSSFEKLRELKSSLQNLQNLTKINLESDLISYELTRRNDNIFDDALKSKISGITDIIFPEEFEFVQGVPSLFIVLEDLFVTAKKISIGLNEENNPGELDGEYLQFIFKNLGKAVSLEELHFNTEVQNTNNDSFLRELRSLIEKNPNLESISLPRGLYWSEDQFKTFLDALVNNKIKLKQLHFDSIGDPDDDLNCKKFSDLCNFLHTDSGKNIESLSFKGEAIEIDEEDLEFDTIETHPFDTFLETVSNLKNLKNLNITTLAYGFQRTQQIKFDALSHEGFKSLGNIERLANELVKIKSLKTTNFNELVVEEYLDDDRELWDSFEEDLSLFKEKLKQVQEKIAKHCQKPAPEDNEFKKYISNQLFLIGLRDYLIPSELNSLKHATAANCERSHSTPSKGIEKMLLSFQEKDKTASDFEKFKK